MGKNSETNKLAFFTLCLIAILYLVGMILYLVGGGSGVYLAFKILTAIATFLLLLIASICGWYYVSSKATVYKVLYIVVILVIIVAYILPLCI